MLEAKSSGKNIQMFSFQARQFLYLTSRLRSFMLRHEQVAGTAPSKLQLCELLQHFVRVSYAFADGPCSALQAPGSCSGVMSTAPQTTSRHCSLSCQLKWCFAKTEAG